MSYVILKTYKHLLPGDLIEGRPLWIVENFDDARVCIDEHVQAHKMTDIAVNNPGYSYRVEAIQDGCPITLIVVEVDKWRKLS